jgi:hypothetical protein
VNPGQLLAALLSKDVTAPRRRTAENGKDSDMKKTLTSLGLCLLLSGGLLIPRILQELDAAKTVLTGHGGEGS